jgi:hypothetical protein
MVSALLELLFHGAAYVLLPYLSFGWVKAAGLSERPPSALAIKRMPDGTFVLGSFFAMMAGLLIWIVAAFLVAIPYL